MNPGNLARNGGIFWFCDLLVLSLLNDASQLRAEEFIKRWCEYRAEMMVVVFVHYDLDAFEEYLVESAA